MKENRKRRKRKHLHKLDYNSNFKRIHSRSIPWSVEFVDIFFCRHFKEDLMLFVFWSGATNSKSYVTTLSFFYFCIEKKMERKLKPRVDQCRHMINKWICNNKQNGDTTIKNARKPGKSKSNTSLSMSNMCKQTIQLYSNCFVIYHTWNTEHKIRKKQKRNDSKQQINKNEN